MSFYLNLTRSELAAHRFELATHRFEFATNRIECRRIWPRLAGLGCEVAGTGGDWLLSTGTSRALLGIGMEIVGTWPPISWELVGTAGNRPQNDLELAAGLRINENWPELGPRPRGNWLELSLELAP